MRLTGLLLVLWAVTPAAGAGLSDVGTCARCHEVEAGLAADDGGHALFVDCLSCHTDRRPGRFGPGHRSVPTSCTSHHTVSAAAHPVLPVPRRRAAERRNCLGCHDPHGSSNAHLIRTALRVRGRLRPIDFHAAGGVVAGGFADPTNPGHGLCEVCHRKTKHYLANGNGTAHFTSDCTQCHDHTAGFAPVVTPANCVVCHTDEGARLDKPGLHHDRFVGNCPACHTTVLPAPGPGHQSKPACTDCHAPADIAAHAPPGVGALPCTQCHDPHGSDNIELVRETVHTTQGNDVPIQFTSRAGKADGSFASVSAPGTGVCEVCHTTTQHYRADGTGTSHYALPCFPCHTHAAGFSAP